MKQVRRERKGLDDVKMGQEQQMEQDEFMLNGSGRNGMSTHGMVGGMMETRK